MAPNQEQEQEQQPIPAENPPTLMCYGKVVSSGTAWKSFLNSVCFQNTKGPWETDKSFPYGEESNNKLPVNKTVQFGSQTVNFQCPPISYSRVPNYAVIDAALQASDGYILFVEGHYCRIESYMDMLRHSLVGRDDQEYSEPFYYFGANFDLAAVSPHRSFPKKPADKTRGVVVVLCGDNDETWRDYGPDRDKYKYENTKKEWEEYCKNEGFPCFEFNAKDSAEKIKETSTKIVEALLAEIEAGKGIKVLTKHFPQDFSPDLPKMFPNLQIAPKQKGRNGPWVRFKRFLGLSKTAAA